MLPIPPPNLRFMDKTEESFLRVGEQTKRQIIQYTLLRPDANILDIGCGYGRIAHAFLRDSSFKGTYVGMDILQRHIAWCKENLENDRFKFHHLDVKNDRYNPKGILNPKEVTFGVPYNSKDLVILTSVFTHMYLDDIKHYLSEIRKILKVGGKLFCTFFILDDSWKECENNGKSTYPMKYEIGDYCRYFSKEDPLHAIGFTDDCIKEVFKNEKLEIKTMELGSWCGRKSNTYQDIVVAKKNRKTLKDYCEHTIRKLTKV